MNIWVTRNRRAFLFAGIIGILVFALAGCGVFTRTATEATSLLSPMEGQAGTTLSATVSGSGFWERTVEYDWAVDKTANPAELFLIRGTSGTIGYTLTVRRDQVSETDVYGVRGEVSVTNGGDKTTENLKIVVQVEYKTGAGQFQPLAGASQTIIPANPLGPGGTGTYAYEVAFTPVAGASYRVAAKVTITNHSGSLGEEKGPEPKADFALPGGPATVEVDEESSLSDEFSQVAGLSVAPGVFAFHGAGTYNYNAEITNLQACGEDIVLANTVTLVESDTRTSLTATALVTIHTGPCVTCAWIGETAWGAGMRYVSRGNWATWTPYSGTPKSATLYAGQSMAAGTVEFSAPDANGLVTVTISLNPGWRFAPVQENVKIEAYQSAASSVFR